MPVYNCEKTVHMAIRSIIKQTYKNWFLILIDDHSNDNTYKTMKKFKSNKIKIYKNNKRLGLTKSLNRIILKLRCEYVARMDADDECLPRRLEKQIEFLDKNKNVSLLGTNVNYYNSDNKRIGTSKLPLSKKNIRNDLSKKNVFIHSTTVFRHSFYMNLGGYNEFFFNAQDYDLWLRGRNKYIYANLKDRLVNHKVKNKIGLIKGFYGVLAMIVNLRLSNKFHKSVFWIFKTFIYIIMREMGYKKKIV